MTLIIVTGMPGSGSSTVIKGALISDERGEFMPLNYGDVMFEAARDAGLVDKRDEMRRLSSEKQQEIQRLACDKIMKWKKSTNLIIDTHCTIKNSSGYLPGLPDYVLREIKPDQFVLIEADPDEILGRRLNDKTRERDVEDEKSLEEHQFMNRTISMVYACLSGAPVKIIKNHDGEVEKAMKDFSELIKGLLKA